MEGLTKKELNYLAGITEIKVDSKCKKEAAWYNNPESTERVRNVINRMITTLEDTASLFEKGSVRGPGTVMSNIKSINGWMKELNTRLKEL